MLNRSSTWQKINFKCTFCGFSFTPMSKCRKRPWNLYKYKNLLLKTYSSLTTEYRMYRKFLQSPRCLNWLVQNKPSATIRRVETMLNSSKDNFITKSFRLSTKRKLRIPLNFLFPCISFIGVFSILKCKALAFKTTTSWTHASHFVDGWHLLRCQIRFFPHPLIGRHDHWTFVGEGSMGDFEVAFFSQTSGVWNFCLKPFETTAFWNDRGEHSLGDRGAVCFYLPLLGESVQTAVRWHDVITKISRMDSLPHFLTHGAPLIIIVI